MDERLDLQQLAGHVWAYRRSLVLLSLAVAVLVLIVGLLEARTYEASAQVLVLSPVATAEGEPRYELTMQSYLELARGPHLLREALRASASALDEAARAQVRLDATHLRDTRLLELTVRAPAARDAALVANEAARQFAELCRSIRAQEILDKQRLVALELEALEQRVHDGIRRLDELLAATGQWTASSVRDELARLRRLRGEQAARSAAAAEAPDATPAAALEARIEQLAGLLARQREQFEAVELQGWKLEQLREAYGALLQRAQLLASAVNERLGHVVLTAEAVVPQHPVGSDAASRALFGGLVTLVVSSSLIVLWAIVRGEGWPGTRPAAPRVPPAQATAAGTSPQA